MITKFKYYKFSNNEPDIGDYVICQTTSILIKKFLSNNIGQLYFKEIGDFEQVDYYVKFENVPIELYDQFNMYPRFMPMKNSRIFSLNDIKYYSPDKEDCEIYLKSKKFNV